MSTAGGEIAGAHPLEQPALPRKRRVSGQRLERLFEIERARHCFRTFGAEHYSPRVLTESVISSDVTHSYSPCRGNAG